MPKYLVQASYTAEGVKGLLKDGGTARLEATRAMVSKLGGEVESYYFAFGENDLYIILDMPDHATVASVSLTVAASGAAQTKTVVLLPPEEIDQASGKRVDFRPPGT